MGTSETYSLVITYTDNSRAHFKFPAQLDKAKMGSTLGKLFSSPVLALQLQDSLMVIPTANIRTAEIIPSPAMLPEVVLHNVEHVHESP